MPCGCEEIAHGECWAPSEGMSQRGCFASLDLGEAAGHQQLKGDGGARDRQGQLVEAWGEGGKMEEKGKQKTHRYQYDLGL